MVDPVIAPVVSSVPALAGSSGNTAIATPPVVGRSVRHQMLLECEAMLRHALASGIRLPAYAVEILTVLEKVTCAEDESAALSSTQLATLHAQLSELVAPAKPRTIHMLLTDEARNRWLSALGPLPTIRRMTTAALVFMLLFVATSLLPQVNDTTVSVSFLKLSGWQQFPVVLFILSAAGLGACFQVVFTANQYVADGTYDPKFESTYWARIPVGIISGLLLAELVISSAHPGMSSFSKPLLALVGGFSSTLVFRVLSRLVDTVESLFKGDRRETAAMQETLQRAKTSQDTTKNRLEMAAQLLSIRDDLAKGMPPERVAESLSLLMGDLLPVRTGTTTPAASATTTQEPDVQPQTAPVPVPAT